MKGNIGMGLGEIRETRLLEFILHTNRNLLLILAVVFSACIFAVTADALVIREREGKATGVMSGVVAGVMIVLVFTLACVHAWMVYRYSTLIGHSNDAWFLIPVGVVLVAWIPLITYLIILYTR